MSNQAVFDSEKIAPLPTSAGGSPSNTRNEKLFFGGFANQKVDVSYSDDANGLMLSVSVKTINFVDMKTKRFTKNLKNRFGDLLKESLNLHIRFPFAVICGFFAFPEAADEDGTSRVVSTYSLAKDLFSSVVGRDVYTDPGEKFEGIVLMKYKPLSASNPTPVVQELYDVSLRMAISEKEYGELLSRLFMDRNPLAKV